MKRNSLFLIAFNLIAIMTSGQETITEEFKPSGKVFGTFFLNYHLNVTENVDQRNSFQIQRTYLGYKYRFSEDISAKITLDGSKESGASDYTMFVKNALVDWKVDSKLKLTGGLMATKQFKVQENFFNYRYVFKAVQDYFGLGPSTDLGINAEYKASETLLFNVFILNGEGYTKAQDNMGRMKGGVDVVFMPIEGLTLKGYYDIYGGNVENLAGEATKDTVKLHTVSLFAGYKTGPLRVGAEYNTQLNGKKYNDIAEDLNLTVLALYGAYTLNERFEVFAEWLNQSSNTLDGADNGWNYSDDDGNIILAGVQFQPVKGIRSALNYRAFIPADSDNTTASLIYLNLELKF